MGGQERKRQGERATERCEGGERGVMGQGAVRKTHTHTEGEREGERGLAKERNRGREREREIGGEVSSSSELQ